MTVKRTSWSTSKRRQRLPDDWPQRRAKVKARANGLCEARPHEAGCDGTGAECDHIITGDDHRLSNLQWLSHVCHRAKTLREAQAGRFRRSNTKRATAKPPGLT